MVSATLWSQSSWVVAVNSSNGFKSDYLLCCALQLALGIALLMVVSKRALQQLQQALQKRVQEQLWPGGPDH